MDVERKPDDTLEFQFKLIDGIIDMSYASLTALKMGIPRDVVDRSEEVNSGLHLTKILSIIHTLRVEAIMSSLVHLKDIINKAKFE